MDQRFQNILGKLPFLESIKNDSKVQKLVEVLKDESRRERSIKDRISQIERFVQKCTEKYKDKIADKKKINNTIKLGDVNISRITECIELESDNDEEVTVTKNTIKNEESSDEEIQFYQVNNLSETVKPPNPCRTEVIIKIEENIILDDDSDLEIVSYENVDDNKNEEKNKLSIKSEKNELKKIKSEKSENSTNTCELTVEDKVKISEKNLFTRRNDKTRSENSKINYVAKKHAPSIIQNEDERQNVTVQEVNIEKIVDTIALSDSDDEREISNKRSNVSINLNKKNKKTIENDIVDNSSISKHLTEKYNGETKAQTEKLFSNSNQNFKTLKNISIEHNLDKSDSTSDIAKIVEEKKENSLEEKSLDELKDIGLSLVEKFGFGTKLPTLKSPQCDTNSPINRDPRLLKQLSSTCTQPMFQKIIPPNVNSTNLSLPFYPLTPETSVPLPLPEPDLEAEIVLSLQHTLHPSAASTSFAPATGIQTDKPRCIIHSSVQNSLINSKYSNKNQNNLNVPKCTPSKISYGEYVRQKKENKLRAEREAYERGVREAESLGLSVPQKQSLESISKKVTKTPSRDTLDAETIHSENELKTKSICTLGGKEKNKEISNSNIRKESKTVEKNKTRNANASNNDTGESTKVPRKIRKRRMTHDASYDTVSSTKNSEDNRPPSTNAFTEDKIPDKNNEGLPTISNLNGTEMAFETFQCDGNQQNETTRVEIIKALRDQFKDFLSEKQLLNIDNVVNTVMTKDVNEITKNTEDLQQNNNASKNQNTSQNQNALQNQREIKEIKRKNVCRKSTAKPIMASPNTPIKNKNESRELKSLHEQIYGFHDRDEILAAAGTTRSSSKLASEKIKSDSYKRIPSDDESCKKITISKNILPHQNHTKKTAKPLAKRRQSCHFERRLNESDEEPRLPKLKIAISKHCMKESSATRYNIVNDEDYDTDDFSSYFNEKQAQLKKQLTKKDLIKSILRETPQILLKRITSKDFQKKMPILKPLEVIPVQNSTTPNESQRKKSNTKSTTVLLNINAKHHCKNEDFMSKCVVCKKGSNDIVSHYVHFHTKNPNHEVYCARLPYFIIAQFKQNPVIGELIQKKPYSFAVICIFCGKRIVGCHNDLMEHYATHTGEYAWRCNSCDKKSAFKKDILNHCKSFCETGAKHIRFYTYKKQDHISGTFCTECYYIQLNKANVVRHLQKHHSIIRRPEILCENLILVKLLEKLSSAEISKEKCQNEEEFSLTENEVDMSDIEHEVDEAIRVHNEAVNHNTTNISNLDQTNTKEFDDLFDIKPEILDELDEIFASEPEASIIESQNIYEEDVPINIKTEEIQSNTKFEFIEVCNPDDEILYIDSDEDDNNKNVNQIELTSAKAEGSLKSTASDEMLMSNETSLLRPWLNIKESDIRKSKEILSNINLSDYFKCTQCVFSTNVPDEMLNHFKKHSALNNVFVEQKFLECCYCIVSLRDPAEMINHIKTEHAGCNFQCSKCFYRSCSSFSVKFHIYRFHEKNHKILVCDGPEISTANQFKIIIENRQQHFKPFDCHLCSGKANTKFYLKEDFENHFKKNHHNAVLCKCDHHNLICCLFCNFETNSKDRMKVHMTDTHPNREQYVAARFRNSKYNNTGSSKPNSAVIVFLSEVLSEKYFEQSKILSQKLQKVYENKKYFKITAANSGETLWNVHHLTSTLKNNLTMTPEDEFTDSVVSLDVAQEEFYSMAKVATFNKGFSDKDLYKCLKSSCKNELENYQKWLNHIQVQHGIKLDDICKCPHCTENYRIKEFNNHFSAKHSLHKYFCYLCGLTGSSLAIIQHHLNLYHLIQGSRHKVILPADKYPEEFVTVVPNGIFCDASTLTLHMRNLLRVARYHFMVKNFNEISKTNVDNENVLKLPKYISLENHRYKCLEDNCSFITQSEDSLENHFKNIHRCLKSFKCPHCLFKIEEEIRDFDLIKDHFRLHSEILFVCTKCPFYHHQRQIVQKHIRQMHKLQMNMTKCVRSYRDKIYKFVFEISLEEGHIFLLLNICVICGEHLLEPDKTIDHLRQKHFVTVFYECQYCKAIHRELKKIIEHINKDHNKVIKMQCKFEYSSNGEDFRSNNNTNEAENVNDVTTRNVLPEPCNEMIRTTSKKRSNEEEKKEENIAKISGNEIHQFKKLKTDSDRLDPAKLVHIFICEDCNFEAFTRSNLLIHKKNNHKNNLTVEVSSNEKNFNNTDESSLRCEYCEFSCDTQKNLNEHKFINNHIRGQMKFSCQRCRNEYDSLLDLKQHNLIDHQQLLENTPSATTINQSEIKKIYRCEFCEYISDSIMSMKEHKLSIHENNSVHAILGDGHHIFNMAEIDFIKANQASSSTKVNTPQESSPPIPPPAARIRVKPIASLLDPLLMSSQSNTVVAKENSKSLNLLNILNQEVDGQKIPVLIQQRQYQNENIIFSNSISTTTTPSSSTIVHSNLKQILMHKDLKKC